MDFVLAMILGSMGFGQKGWFVIGLNQHGFLFIYGFKTCKSSYPITVCRAI